jgi:hypothetical protein
MQAVEDLPNFVVVPAQAGTHLAARHALTGEHRPDAGLGPRLRGDDNAGKACHA